MKISRTITLGVVEISNVLDLKLRRLARGKERVSHRGVCSVQRPSLSPGVYWFIMLVSARSFIWPADNTILHPYKQLEERINTAFCAYDMPQLALLTDIKSLPK